MPPLLTVTGRDVLFAHWAVKPEIVEPLVPGALEIETYDGSAWVSALALENPSVAPGSAQLPKRFQREFPQLNFRTYVSLNGQSGVYFLSLDSGSRAPAAVGRQAFGLPFHRARMRMTRRGDEITFQSQRDSDDSPPAIFQARYCPTGDSYQAATGSLEAFCVERFRYYLPTPENHRLSVLQAFDSDQSGMYVGTIEREPWELRPVTATIHRNTLFEAAGLPAPTNDPVVQFSPGFEMAVQP